MLYTLSRKLITGNININTPIVVLEEICSAHGIDFAEEDITIDDYIETIDDTEIVKVSMNNKRKTASYIVRFVNKDCDWNLNSLKQAFNFLIQFSNKLTKEEIIGLIPSQLFFGQQTINNINSINYCICYKVCNLFGIKLNSKSTKSDLEMAVRLLKYKEENLRSFVYKMDKTQLVNYIMNMNDSDNHKKDSKNWTRANIGELEDSNDSLITSDSLKMCFNDFNSIEKMQYFSKPTLNKSAISLCAILYKLDISKLSDPVSEFYNIKDSILKEHEIKNKTGKDYIGNPTENAFKNYIPKDKWFNTWYIENPKNFNLRYQFNPIFPVCYYKKEFLKEYLKEEGVKTNEEKILALYQNCVKYYKECNFHEYKQPNMCTNETIEMYQVNEIEKKYIICWGSKSDTMIPMTVSEILKCFNANNKYVNPLDMRASLSENCINKLKNICTKNNLIPDYKDLSDKIIYFENIKLLSNEKTIKFIKTFEKMSAEDKSVIIKLLRKILKMGMYMRGWRRNDIFKERYPLTLKDCELSGDEADNVDYQSRLSIEKYKEYSKKYIKLSKIVETLPLCFMHLGIYEISSENAIGRTLGARITIVAKGESHKDLNSCIRLTSNYFITSSYRYLVLIGEKVPFDITKMDEIS